MAYRAHPSSAVALAWLLLVGSAAAQDDLAGLAPIDAFNPDVTAKDGSENEPVRGGTLRVGTPGDPKSLNPMCDNDSPTRQVHQYLRDDLVARDPETFEWLPTLARWFEIADTVELTDGTRLVGRIVSETDTTVRFAAGVSRITVGEHDLLRFEPKDGGEPFAFNEGHRIPDGARGTVVPKEGSGLPTLNGVIQRPPGGRYTLWIEQTPSAVREIAAGDVAYALEGDEGAKQSQPALRREVDFVFHLRQDVRWHDRQPVTADDVIFSFDTIMNPAVDAAELRQFFEDLESYEKTDDFTVHFRYKRQYFGAFSSCASAAYVYPRHRFDFDGDSESFGKHFNEHKDHSGPISMGPYKFSRWDRGKMVEIVRNDDWWVTPLGPNGKRISLLPWVHPERPFLDRIRWIIINNKASSLKALRNGEIDANFDIEPSTWVEPETNDPKFLARFVRARFLQPLYTYVGWNQERKGVGPERQFFKDSRVRRAMTLLIPRRKILAEIHHGLGEIVTGPFFKYGPFADKTVRLEEGNLRRAQLLLDAAGWIDHDGDGIRDRDGVSFEFDYIIHNMRDYHQKIADIIKESVERAGVRMSIRKLDWAVFVDTVQDQQFDAVRFAWGEPSCIDTDPFQIWHSSQAAGRGSNYISFTNSEADRLILAGRRELNVPKRQILFRRLHRLLAREQPYTFLFNFYSLYFYSRRLRNVRFCVIGEDPYVFSDWFIPKELQGE